MAGAPKGNKNAEKWTLDESQKFINSILDYVDSDVKCTSLEKACCEIGQYESLLVYLENKHKDIDLMPIKKAKAIIKARLIENGLNNKYNPTMCIFILKNNHDMNETQNHNLNLNSENIPPLKWFDNDTDS